MILVLLMFGAASAATAAPEEAWHLRPSRSIDQIRSDAREGDSVTVQGRVVSVRNSRLFTLEDDSGSQIVVVIPNHVQREQGKPENGEVIRIRGKYDHKTFVDTRSKDKGAPEKTWGVRVSELARNVETSGRNPHRPDPSASAPHEKPSAKEAPAAPVGLVTVGTPNTPRALKDQLGAARQRALKARKDLESANVAFNRAESDGIQAAERADLAQRQAQAQQEYDDAIAAIGPLVEEAREAGVDPKAIELFEAGVTKAPR
jgi:uncharacterized protein YdeI (BOF family)